MRIATRVLTTLVLPALLGGCELSDLFDAIDGGEPVEAEAAVDVAGTWTLRGTGELSKCQDDRYETDGLKIRSRSLNIRQATQPAPDGGVASMAVLHLDGQIDGFEFLEGKVTGSTVTFTTDETSAAGKIVLHFEGKLNEIGEIAGTFEGLGPSSCTSEGDFAVSIER